VDLAIGIPKCKAALSKLSAYKSCGLEWTCSPPEMPFVTCNPSALAPAKIRLELPLVLLWTLLPCPVIWFGMTTLKSAVLSLLMLHIVCIVPALVWGYSLWRNDLKRPTLKQTLVLLAASIGFIALSLGVYQVIGDHLLNSHDTVDLIMNLGYRKYIIYPVGLYFVLVNATLEELFWRGVILNKMETLLPKHWKPFGLAWTSVTYAIYHYSILRLILFPGWAELGVLMLASFGVLMAWLYRKTGSLVLPSMYHAFLPDITAIILIAAMFCRLQIPGML